MIIAAADSAALALGLYPGMALTQARALVPDLAHDLLARGLGTRLVRLVCERVDREEQIVAVGTARDALDVPHMLRLLGMKIETIEPGFGIERMGLVALRTEPLGAVALGADLGPLRGSRLFPS